MRGIWRLRGQDNHPDLYDEVPSTAIAIAFDIAGAGIGLAGPGAVSAARALVLYALSESGLGPDCEVVVTQADLEVLLGQPCMGPSSAAVTVVSTVDAALTHIASKP